MIENAESYHEIVKPLTVRGRAASVLDLCDVGKVAEARLLLLESDDPAMCLARGVVYHHLAKTGSEFTQEEAKDWLTRSERSEDHKHLSQVFLGLCYWRQGQEPEALVMLGRAAESGDPAIQYKAAMSLLQLQCEKKSWLDGMRTVERVAPLVEHETICNQARFYHHRGWLYRLGHEATADDKYLQCAVDDYQDALDLYEQAGNDRLYASVQNNLAFLYIAINTHRAHDCVDAALSVYRRIGDRSGLGSAKDTKAQIFLHEGNLRSAKKYADESIALLRRSDDDRVWMAGSLITRGEIYAKMKNPTLAMKDFELAMHGKPVEATVAAIESLADQLSFTETVRLFRLLPDAPGMRAGLALMDRVQEILSTPAATLRQAERDQESERIKIALSESGGSITKAARLLRLDHAHLIYKIENVYPHLQALRKPKQKRRKKA